MEECFTLEDAPKPISSLFNPSCQLLDERFINLISEQKQTDL